METTVTKNCRLIINGLVQGVSFRQSLLEEAEKHGVKGWCRNLSNGYQVEALLLGEPEAVNALIAWCQHGPPSAKVKQVEVIKLDSTINPQETESFAILPTT